MVRSFSSSAYTALSFLFQFVCQPCGSGPRSWLSKSFLVEDFAPARRFQFSLAWPFDAGSLPTRTAYFKPNLTKRSVISYRFLEHSTPNFVEFVCDIHLVGQRGNSNDRVNRRGREGNEQQQQFSACESLI